MITLLSSFGIYLLSEAKVVRLRNLGLDNKLCSLNCQQGLRNTQLLRAVLRSWGWAESVGDCVKKKKSYDPVQG